MLFVITLLTSLRFRGVFNGGSDAMTLSVLLALAFFPKNMAAYSIAIQVGISYCIAGWVKLKEPAWIQGRALKLFLSSERYSVPHSL